MRSQSLQESLLEEIFALDDMQFPSFTGSEIDRNGERRCESFYDGQKSTPKMKNILKPAQGCSINDLEDQILRMRAQAIKYSYKKPSSSMSTKNPTVVKQKLKTQASEQSSTHNNMERSFNMKTRRSSLDESQTLYDKSMRNSNAKQSWIKKKIKQRNSIDASDCTYTPEINQTSRAIIENVDRHTMYEKMKEKKMRNLMQLKHEEEMKNFQECSFTPHLISNYQNQKSSHSFKKEELKKKDSPKIIRIQKGEKSKRNQTKRDVFSHLYEESKTREIKRKEKQSKAMKQSVKNPMINEVSRKIVSANFNERLAYFESKKNRKVVDKKLKQEKENSFLYHPKINPGNNHRSHQVSIGEHLHSQTKRNKKETPLHESHKPQVNKKSQQVYEERKIVAFYQIFKLLDEDEDGLISAENVNLEMLPREILKIIYPLVDELEAMEVQLEEHQFIQSLHNLFQTLTIHERNVLLGFTPTPKEPEVFPFQPSLNSKSIQIAEYIHRSDLNISEYCSIKEMEREKQLETERVEKTKREMEKCTFHPELIAKIRY